MLKFIFARMKKMKYKFLNLTLFMKLVTCKWSNRNEKFDNFYLVELSSNSIVNKGSWWLLNLVFKNYIGTDFIMQIIFSSKTVINLFFL
jgi:hypothetical protein